MLKPEGMETFNLCRSYNHKFTGLVVVLVGAEAERLIPCFDQDKHDVRACEPYFFKDDAVDWRII